MKSLLALGSLVSVASSLAATVHVLLRYRRPTTAVAWLFAVWLIPILAPIAYVALSVYEGPRSIRRRRGRGASLRRRAGVDGAERDALPDAARLVELPRGDAPFAFRPGHLLEIAEDADRSLERMLETLEGAEREILVQTFILGSGEVLEALLDVVARKSREGVDVRLLFDPIGTVPLPDEVPRRLGESGVRVATFLKPNPLKGRFQVNFRNHRKLVVVDGAVAFLGGRNWADEYFERGDARPARDLTVSVRGPSVAGLRRVFLEDWALASEEAEEEEAPVPPYEPGPPASEEGGAWARPYPIGPDESGLLFTDVLAAAIGRARKSVFVASPYFAPGAALASRLREAALAGVDVTILLPRRSDLRIGDLAARHFARELASVGATFRLYEGFLHAKAVVVDDAWATFGSLNFDQRSFQLNYELNLEVLDERFARSLRAYFDDLLAESVALDPDEKLGVLRRLGERASALFEPLL